MKKYVFIMCGIFGIGGGQRYVSNKAEYMHEKGYEISTFSSFGPASGGGIFYDGVKQSNNYVLTQLRYHPDSCSKRKREHIIKSVIKLINVEEMDEILLESNTLISALWAERIAERIKAKHIVFSVSEHNLIDDHMRAFLEFKFKRGELATITTKSFREVIEKSQIITEKNLPILTAYLGDPVEEVEDERLQNFEKSDHNICIIGRGEKRYVRYACEEVVQFCKKYRDKTFSVALVSEFLDDKLKTKIQALFASAENIRLYHWGYFMPFPRDLFEKFDLYIGGAGCASLPYRQNVLTLAMDLYNDRVLGIMGYDGCTSNAAAGDCLDMKEYLEDVFFNKNYLTKQYTPAACRTADEAFSLHDRLIENSSSQEEYYTLTNSEIGFKEKVKTAVPFLVTVSSKLSKLK